MLYYVCDEAVECVGVCGRRPVRVMVMVRVMAMVMVQVYSTLSRFAQIPRSATH